MERNLVKKLIAVGEARMVTLGGRPYAKKGGKQTLAFAFSYSVGDSDVKRKVVTGNSNEELLEKIHIFLAKKNAEYLELLEEERKAQEEKERPRTLREAGGEWYAEFKKAARTYITANSRECSMKQLNKVAGDVLVKDIDSKMAQEIIDKCSVKEDGNHYSKSSVDKVLQVLQMVMRYAVKQGYCDNEPEKPQLSDSLTEPDEDSRFLDREQLKQVFDAVEGNPRYKVILRLLLATGLRQEEAYALNVNDFCKKKDGSLEIDIYKAVKEVGKNKFDIMPGTKTKRSIRKVPVPEVIYKEVMQYYESCVSMETPEQKRLRVENGTEGTLFVNKDMKPFNKRTFQRNCTNYLKKRGIDYPINLHMFRHSFVSFQAEKMSLDKIAKIIGDSLEVTNRIYQSVTAKTRAEICEYTMELFNSL